MRITVCRQEHFNAAHRVANPKWDLAKNQEVFGKCANPHYHGHNYELIVKLTGEVDDETGYLVDLKYVSEVIKEEIIEPFDHKNLNIECPEFENTIASSENFARIIWQKLRNRFSNHLELKIVLYETPRNWVEYEGK